MPGIRVDHYLVLNSDAVQHLIELLHGSRRNGCVTISEKAEDRRSKKVELIEKRLHLTAVEGADGRDGSPQPQSEGHTPSKTEAHAAYASITIRTILEGVEGPFEFTRGTGAMLVKQRRGLLAVAEGSQITVVQVGGKCKITKAREAIGDRASLLIQAPPFVDDD